MSMRQQIVRSDNGWTAMRFTHLWRRVKAWAKRNGHKYDDYHVEGVAAL